MEYRLERTSQGWRVIRADAEDTNGESVAGPFPTRVAAVAWIEDQGRQTEAAAQRRASEARTEAGTDAAIVAALKAAIENPPPPPRGRPTPDHPREADIAFEYYWRIRQGRSATRSVAAIAKAFACTPDHVRKVRAEYAPVAKYDDRLIEQLRADAWQRRRGQVQPKAVSEPPLSAEQWLRILLERGPVLAQEVFQRGKIAGFSKRTLERAKRALGIESPRGGRTSTWQLPAPNSAKGRI